MTEGVKRKSWFARWLEVAPRPTFGERVQVHRGFYAGHWGVVLQERLSDDYWQYQLRLEASPVADVSCVWVSGWDLRKPTP